MQTYQTYFKREFDKKRENSGVLARFVLFLAGIIQAEFTYSGSKMRAIDINLSAVGALLLSIVREPPVTLFAERQNGIILDLHKAMELIHARLIRKGTCVDGDKCDYAICEDK